MTIGLSVRLSPLGLVSTTLFATLFATSARGQDIKLNVTFVCNGERLYVENCNIRDLSDTATCMVAHPDRPKHNGFMAYSSDFLGVLIRV